MAIVGWFLIQTMGKLNTTEKQSISNKTDIALLKQETNFKHNRLEEKLDELKDSNTELKNSIVDLTQEFREFNNRLNSNG